MGRVANGCAQTKPTPVKNMRVTLLRLIEDWRVRVAWRGFPCVFSPCLVSTARLYRVLNNINYSTSTTSLDLNDCSSSQYLILSCTNAIMKTVLPPLITTSLLFATAHSSTDQIILDDLISHANVKPKNVAIIGMTVS